MKREGGRGGGGGKGPARKSALSERLLPTMYATIRQLSWVAYIEETRRLIEPFSRPPAALPCSGSTANASSLRALLPRPSSLLASVNHPGGTDNCGGKAAVGQLPRCEMMAIG